MEHLVSESTVTVRRTSLSGKRKVIGDDSILTAANNFRGVALLNHSAILRY
jgi:hypothetical protein